MIISATMSDIASIQQIARFTWFETYGAILSAEQINYMLDLIYSTKSLEEQMKNGHQFFLLQQNGERIGFIDIEKTSETRTKLHKIYLLPNQQAKGYGKLLINLAVEKAGKQGSSILQLNVNRYNNAIEFYKKSGFRIVEETDIPIGNGYFMNDYVMEKILS
ncbi:MAG TPA: GNAT family N-acetyltransferase [Arachidicoccus sp.]